MAVLDNDLPSRNLITKNLRNGSGHWHTGLTGPHYNEFPGGRLYFGSHWLVSIKIILNRTGRINGC